MAAAATIALLLLPTSYALIPTGAYNTYNARLNLKVARKFQPGYTVAYASTVAKEEVATGATGAAPLLIVDDRVAIPGIDLSVIPSDEDLASPDAPVRDASFWLPRGALLLMAATCATNFPILTSLESIPGLAPSTIGTLRFLVALVPFLPTLLFATGTTKKDLQETALPGLEIGAWCLVGYVTQAIGLSITSAARGAFIGSMFMIVPPLVGGLSGKKVSTPTWVAVALALCGMAVLEGVAPGMGGGGAGLNAGDLWCGGTALGFGLMFTRMESHMERLSSSASLPLTAWQLVSMAVGMSGWSAYEAISKDGSLDHLLSQGIVDCRCRHILMCVEVCV